MRTAVLVGFALLAFAGGCDSARTPVGPVAGGLNLSGTWSGPLTVDTTEARMLWDLTQINDVVTGPVTLVQPDGFVLLNGFLTGSISGMTMPYTIAVNGGQVPSRPTCTGQLAGTMNVAIGTVATLSGPLGVASSNCAPPFNGATMTLTRQQ